MARQRNQRSERQKPRSAPRSRPEKGLPSAQRARLEELEHRFQSALEREKIEALAEFSAGAGHEINNPLTVIAGHAQNLLKQESDPQRRRSLALIVAQAQRITELIADLRLFARPPLPRPALADLTVLVDRALRESAAAAAAQSTLLHRTGWAGPLLAEVDAEQIGVALKALISNAMAALRQGGNITLDLAMEDGAVCLSVRDDGPGIQPEERQHLFDPYYSARQAGRGLGLGLAKCWRIVTLHGGRIEVESEPGQGALFRLHLVQAAESGKPKAEDA